MRWFWPRCGRCGLRQAEESARFGENIGEAIETAAQRDQVEKIAMLTGGGIALMFNCT